MLRFPSPHSGILFLCLMFPNIKGNLIKVVSVPSFGDSFFICLCKHRTTCQFPVSVPSFGDSFFMTCACIIITANWEVSVPSFGDSFFMVQGRDVFRHGKEPVSVPSFGDSFFMRVRIKCIVLKLERVSVPSFGDSFFIFGERYTVNVYRKGFPSPHSGILFL